MAENLEVGVKLHAMYTDGEFYPAEVLAVSSSKQRAKAPVKVEFAGFEGSDTWLPLAKLKSKLLPAAAASGAKTKAKAYDYSGLSNGMRVQVESGGVYYAADVVTVSTKKKSTPVKVHFAGYTDASDEWVGGDRLRSKALTVKDGKDAGAKKEKKDAKPAEPKPITILEGMALKKAEGELYNPEWNPAGDEGGVDTNTLPWIPLPHIPGCSVKPLRVSKETGAFTMVLKLPKGTVVPDHVLLGASDTFIISGKLTYAQGPLKGEVGPGIWGYTPALVRMQGTTAAEDTEYLQTFYAPVAFLDKSGKAVKSLLTGHDVRRLASEWGVRLLPNTLLEALAENPQTEMKGTPGKLAITKEEATALCGKAMTAITELTNPHYVDTNALPWIGAPDDKIKLKVMRVSAETGTVSLIVKQNGPAPPHYHLGPADFFITSGKIGYRAGPPEGYGPGTYMYEPAGARHESTQPVETDLIYTANVYGPIQFDSGVGTKVEMVFSWMSYLEAAKAFNSPLMASTFPDDATLLAPAIGVH
jgi:hypothetical protein